MRVVHSFDLRSSFATPLLSAEPFSLIGAHVAASCRCATRVLSSTRAPQRLPPIFPAKCLTIGARANRLACVS